ncbi:Dipeptidyl aminopeptidase/acylaminoacyl peptidase [Geodermatophilus siccatus]|uniref:Dipeptidyl aminopeptidase/acylaminoacyl peptidase n=1 Tax=Geodermatophilus siccatus TaxID=1137991 RepID=A0A1G9RMB2_9ACTN|nr:prolyl oligopeptidase family serine peptidase [Geodermatophilus siccatus]SDM24354.1 Dipeptidyl aminopeptidase/acylaminoacyl peptidase [Geodermatophilus siccatus]
MRPDDLALLRTPGVPTVSPDGRMAVVAVTRPDPGDDAERSRLWAVPTDGSAPARPLTPGPRDTDPVFSPDGRWLAYRGAEPGGPPQLHLLPTAGGAPRRLTDAPLGTGRPVWSPDSRRLAWTARVPQVDRSGVDRAAQPPWLVTTLRWQADGAGVVTDRHSHLFVLDLPPAGEDDGTPPRPRQVTDGNVDDTDVTWSPDGAELAFVSARHARADRDLVRDVYAVPAAGGTLRRVTDGRAECARPAYDPSGDWIWLTARLELGRDGLDVVGRGATLCRVRATGGALEPVLAPAATDRGDATPATVLAGRAAHLGVHSRGAVELLRVPLDGGSPEALVDGPFTVHGLAAAGGVVVATVGHNRSAGELIAVTPGRRRLLTGFGRALGATGRLHRSEERTATAPDGAEVHGWVTVPGGPGPHPVLLCLSDPLRRPEGWSLSVDTQVLVSAGYAVVRCAPRGSPGYGQAHARAVRGAGGTVDADDVTAFLDAVLTDPALDPERVGVMGTGYGGWLATVLTGRTTRFAAAVVDGALTDPAGLVGTSDVGWWFVDQYLGVDPPVPSAATSTPTLVVHGEDDRRFPREQGVRRYVELKRRGVPAELLLFPGEGSDLGRTGRPRHRLARLDHLLRWWARWLPVTPDQDLPGAVVDGAPLPGDHDGRGPLTVRATRLD